MSTIALAAGTVDLVAATFTGPTGVRNLTPTELALLEALWKASPASVSKKELLRTVWGYAESAETRTVGVTVQRLRAKIERNPKDPVSLITRHRVGYALQGVQTRTIEVAVPRESLVAQLRTALEQGPVQLVGPIGCGKSTLARWVCPQALWVELDGRPLLPTLRRALKLDDPQIEDDAVARSLPMLVLDNATQLQVEEIRWLQTHATELLFTTERPLFGTLVRVPELDPTEAALLLDDRRRAAGLGPIAAAPLLDVLGGNPRWICIAAPIAELLTDDPTLVLDLDAGGDRLGSLLWRSLQDVGEPALSLLQAASTFAGTAPTDALLHVSDLPRMDFLRRLQQLRERGLLDLSDGVALPASVRILLRQEPHPHYLDRLRSWIVQSSLGAPTLRAQHDDLLACLPGARGEQQQHLVRRLVDLTMINGDLSLREAAERELKGLEDRHIAELLTLHLETEWSGPSPSLQLRTHEVMPHLTGRWRRMGLAQAAYIASMLGLNPDDAASRLLDDADAADPVAFVDAVKIAAFVRCSDPRLDDRLRLALRLAGSDIPVRTLYLHTAALRRHPIERHATPGARDRAMELLDLHRDILGPFAAACYDTLLGMVDLDAGDLRGIERCQHGVDVLQTLHPRRADATRAAFGLRLICHDPERAKTLCSEVTTGYAAGTAALAHALIDRDRQGLDGLSEGIRALGIAFLDGADFPDTEWPQTTDALRTARKLSAE